MTRMIKIFDTTLRDGEQSPGASMNTEEKIQVAHTLARLNVDIVEAGFPISSDGDFESVSRISREVKGICVAGLARAVEKDIERCYEAVKHADEARIHTFIATSDIHIKKKFKKTREEVKEMAVAAVKFAKSKLDNVEFSCEDACRTDPDYMVEVLRAVIDAGATTVNIPDTVGYTTPQEFFDRITKITNEVENIDKAVISVHCHNDLGLAVANSLAAVEAGAGQIECTINGIGERAGNCSLEEVVMGLKTRKDFYDLDTRINTKEIYRASRLVSTLTGIVVQPNKAIVGDNAFAHESGIHQDGVLKDALTYEIMSPEDIGLAKSNLVLGRRSGRHAFKARLEDMGYTLSEEDIDKAFTRFKKVADKKKEIYEEDLEAMIDDEVGKLPPIYELDYMKTSMETGGVSEGVVRLNKAGETLEATENGNGQADAIFKAIDKITGLEIELLKYDLRAVSKGQDALGEVTVKIRKDNDVVKGRGASTDITEASAKAYVNAINRLIHRQEKVKGNKGS
jgi:2-isopropylmalate synthase